jgi:hypothetical protein
VLCPEEIALAVFGYPIQHKSDALKGGETSCASAPKWLSIFIYLPINEPLSKTRGFANGVILMLSNEPTNCEHQFKLRFCRKSSRADRQISHSDIRPSRIAKCG